MQTEKQDLIVIGGGVAGLVTTSVAAQLGVKVTLIEKHKQLGGDCLHYGCVPSKTMIHAAKVAHIMRYAANCGLNNIEPDINLGKINDHIATVIAHIQQHDDPERFRSYGADVLFGTPQFTDPHSITVNGNTIQGKRFLIATGSEPAIPPIPGLKDTGFITNQTVFRKRELPKHLIILGAGVIGIELAQCFARFGSKVTVVEMLDRILPTIDTEISSQLQTVLSREGINFHLSTRASAVSQNNELKQLSCETKEGEKLQLTADEILVATGQAPNTTHLNLETAGVKYSKQGIVVDKRLRTSAKHIYAAGDVLDLPYKFTHVAEYQAGIIISNAIFRFPKKVNYHVVPAVVFSDPEIAMVGMSEEQAKAAGKLSDTLRFDFKDIDRAITDGETMCVCDMCVCVCDVCE